MLKEIETSIFMAIVIPIIGIIGKFIVNLIKIKVDEIQQRMKDEKLKKYLQTAEDIIIASVEATNQTFVSTLKKNGTWSKENWTEAMKQSRNTALATMGNGVITALKNEIGECTFEIWLDTKLEQMVGRFKDPSVGRADHN